MRRQIEGEIAGTRARGLIEGLDEEIFFRFGGWEKKGEMVEIVVTG